MKRLFLIVPGILFTIVLLSCRPRPQEAYYPPRPDTPVNDYADLLSPATRSGLDGLLRAVHERTGSAVVVVTMKSIAPETIEEYASKLFEKWGIGEKGKDDGILILVAVEERKARIEVGYGLEGAIPDARTFAIVQNVMLPLFKQGDFDRGINQAARAVVGLVAEEAGVEIEGAAPPPLGTETVSRGSPNMGGWVFGIVVLVFILIAILRSGSRRSGTGSRRGGFWTGGGTGGFSGGFSGGGFGGFGGGMSGGGGASGGW